MDNKKRKTIKIVIVVLSVLLAVSIIALAGRVIYNKLYFGTGATVTVPDNLITPDESETDVETTNANFSTAENKDMFSADAACEEITVATVGTDKNKSATEIKLYNKQPQDNTAFSVGNMFPGDKETKYYRVQVSYHGKVTVHFNSDVRKHSEKLAEAMKVKVKLLTTGETLYEGLMRDMPKNIIHELSSVNTVTDELYYEITASLDTSVGNEYQNKVLIADFKWWVEETDNLDKAPQTGDTSDIFLWMTVAITSVAICVILLLFRRKKEEEAK